MKHQSKIKTKPQRNAVATVELAVCLPMLLIFALVAIEVCGMLQMGQTLKIASYEGARVGVVPGAEDENVRFQVETLLESRNVKAYTISMDPADPSLLTEGEYFEVLIDVELDQNSYLGDLISSNRVMTRSTALRSN